MNRIPQRLFEKLTAAAVNPAPAQLPVYDGTPDPSLASLKELNLQNHLARFEGLVFNGNEGKALCPVHQETTPSFQVKRYTDGHWYWFDWHNQSGDGFSGTIIDYYVTIKKMALGEAIRLIKQRENIQAELERPAVIQKIEMELESSDDESKPFEGTLGQFLLAPIPEPIPLITGLFNENEFMLEGGVKGSHKTTLMMNMGLACGTGVEFLGFKPARPLRFLMIQQELNEGEFQKRLRAAVARGNFDTDNFFPYTGTANPIKLLDKDGFKRLITIIEKFKPDIIGLDPLSKFHRVNESDPRVWGEIRDVIHFLKVTYSAVVLSQHFTSKRPKDDPTAPVEAAGWFRGHTVLSDSADALFCLHRLPGQKDNPRLQLPYESYNMVEIELRNGRWPARFATEMDESSFLITRSDVWQEIGAKIERGNVREVVDAHGDEMLFAELVKYYQSLFGQGGITSTTVRKAVDREVSDGFITTEKLPGRGKPILIRSKVRIS